MRANHPALHVPGFDYLNNVVKEGTSQFLNVPRHQPPVTSSLPSKIIFIFRFSNEFLWMSRKHQICLPFVSKSSQRHVPNILWPLSSGGGSSEHFGWSRAGIVLAELTGTIT